MPEVLIVDDDENIRDILQKFLRGYDLIPVLFESVEEARIYCRKNRVDLALLDINLAGEHGVSYAWELRQLFPELPIIIMSSALEGWDCEDIKDCGADELVAKPFDLMSLLSSINRLLGNS